MAAAGVEKRGLELEPIELTPASGQSFHQPPVRRSSALFRSGHRHRWLTVTVSVFAILILLISAFSGLVKGQSPGPVIQLSGMTPATIGVGQSDVVHLRISGGYVDQTHPYTLMIFEGKSNATAVQAITRYVVPNVFCQNYHDNCTYTTNTSFSVTYAWPGSYDLSVTVNDTEHNYRIATDLITVTTSVGIACEPEAVGRTINGMNYTGVNVTFSALSSPQNGTTYLWDFGDGTQVGGGTEAYSSWMTEAPGCRAHDASNWNLYGVYGVNHIYTHPGDYVVSVTISNEFGASARAFVKLNVSDPLPAIENATIPSSAVKNSPVTFFANASDENPIDLPNLTFAWNFGDGTPWQISHVNHTTSPKSQNGAAAETEISHTYTSAQNYQVALEVFNEYQNVTVNPAKAPSNQVRTGTITVSSTPGTGSCPGGGSTPVDNLAVIPVGSCFTGISTYSTQYNASWANPDGKAYGLTGYIRSYSYGPQSFPVYLNTSTGSSVASRTATPAFTDVAPIVGATSLTVTPTITLSVGGGPNGPRPPSGPCYFSTISLSLLNGSSLVTEQNLSCGQPSVTLPVYPLYLGNSYSVEAQYNPVGGSGSTPAILSYSFAGNASNPRQYSWTFTNSNPLTWTWDQDAMAISVGEPVTVGTAIFSFADVSLTTTWTFGDGGNTQVTSPAPSQLGPTYDFVDVTHTWAAGRPYDLSIQTTDPVFGGQGGLSGENLLQVNEVGDLTVNDTAPSASISLPSLTGESDWTSVSATALQADGTAGATNLTWYFGDGANGWGTSTHHNFESAGTYPIVVVARSAVGSESARFQMLDVSPAPVFPSVNCTPSSPGTYTVVSCSATNTTIGSNGLAAAAIGWNFGDGTDTGGSVAVAGTVQHLFTTAGIKTINLTVQSADGIASTVSIHVSICALAFGLTLPQLAPIADEWEATSIHPGNCTGVSYSPSFGYFENVTWSWGGGWGHVGPHYLWVNKFGVNEGTVYVVPGVYWQNATIYNVLNLTQTTEDQRVTVHDYPVSVALPYQGASIYGENHSTEFTATALGGLYDSEYNTSSPWNLTWRWGDGTPNAVVSTWTDTSSVAHWYNTTGKEQLEVTATSPEPAAYRISGSGFAQIGTVLDSDGDGLPNVYETTFTNTSPYLADTADRTGAWGVGLTDFQAGMLNGLLSNLSSDQDGDGLTDIQEILGSVTGFPSNPLDANTAGDGIPDGGHFFTDSFRASNVENIWPVSSGSNWTHVTIPGVGYEGASIAFNQSKFVVQFNTTTDLSHLHLYLVTADGVNVTLPTPTNFTNTYYLMNMSAVAGLTSLIQGNLNLQDYQDLGNWTLAIEASAVYAGGSIPSAYVQDSYYTNPSVADPYHQGMLEGSSITIPVFNCSAPQNETYWVFNATAYTLTKQSYWPYTEQYEKLSVKQGVPYAPGTNSTMTSGNTGGSGGTCPSNMPSSILHAVATYYGDADFGISPWNVHAAGDPSLTNGMKVLGATNYNATAWKYLNTIDQMISVAGTDPYPSDDIGYHGALNPTAASSSGDGVMDSQAADPVSPLVLGVTINYAVDPQCITTGGPFTDIVGVSTGGPTVYTPGVDGSGGSSSWNCWFPWAQNMDFSFDDSYTLPVNNGGTRFAVALTLFHNATFSAPIDAPPVVLSGSLQEGVKVYTPSGSAINASVQVLALSRANTIYLNTTEEVANLPGYGIRYTGEQELYTFYVSLGSNATAPFESGVNVILESRKAFLASPAAGILENATTQFGGSALSCLGSADVTGRTTNSTPSETGVAGTLSVNLTTNPSCAQTLLTELLARNATGVAVGRSQLLNSTQVDLMGLANQVSGLAAYAPPNGFNSQLGIAPNGFLNSIVESAVNYFVGGLVAIANFIALAAKAMVALGQLILGAIEKALGTVAAAAEAAAKALEALASFIVALATSAINALLEPIKNAVQAWGNGLVVAYDKLWAAINNSANSTVLGQDSLDLILAIFSGPFTLAVGMGTALMIVIALVTGFTLGGGFLVGLVVSLLLQALIAAVSYAGYNIVQFLSIGSVNAVYGVFNQSKSLSPLSPLTGSGSCAGYSNLATMVGLSAGLLSVAFAEDDIASLVAKVLYFGNTPGQSWSLFVQPILELAMGALSVLLIALIQHGNLPSYLKPIPLFLGIFGVLSSIATLAYAKLKFGATLSNPTPFIRLTEISLGVGAFATGIGVYDFTNAC